MNDYDVDLARIHHEGHGELAGSAGPAVVHHLRRAGIDRGLVVDLGCGSGILARHLLKNGHDVLGVEPSRSMLQIAKGIAPTARLIHSRAEDVTLPRCMAVLATGEALTYLPARVHPAAHPRRHIDRVSAALMPGGLFIFDAIQERNGVPLSYRTWRAARDWAVLAEVREDRRRHVVSRHITTFARVNATYWRAYTEHRVGVYDRKAVLRDLRARGFVAQFLHRLCMLLGFAVVSGVRRRSPRPGSRT